MLKWRLKACSRCRGDVFIDRDIDGWYEQCLQCGYRREMRGIWDSKKQQPVPVPVHRENWNETED